MIWLTICRDESGPDFAQVVKLVVPDSDFMRLSDADAEELSQVLNQLKDLVERVKR